VNGDRRFAALDGLRGLAIGLVLIYHCFARWPAILPYGEAYAGFPFQYGLLGVELFFLISGYVIFMTLEKCDGFGTFIWRRWLRLFPAMLACSILVYLTAPIFGERPAGMPRPIDLVPGLSLVDDKLLVHLFPSIRVLEGAFWSIFVEVKFYLVFGLAYFAFGWRGAVALLIVGLAASLVAARISEPAFALLDAIGAPYYGWFASGVLLYRWHGTQDRRTFLIAGLVSLLTAYGYSRAWDMRAAAGISVIMFIAALRSAPLQRWLASPIPLFVGMISYPLYLLHENMVVASIVKIGRWFPWVPDLLMPLLPIVLVLLLAWLVTRYVEPAVKACLRGGASAARARMLRPAA